MPPPPTQIPGESLQRAQRLPLLLLNVMGVLLLIVGFTSVWTVSRLDRKYSDTLENVTKALDQVHDITFNAGMGYAHAVELRVVREPARRTNMLTMIKSERAANDQLFADIQSVELNPSVRRALDDTLQTRHEFRRMVDAYIEKFPTGSDSELSSGEAQEFLSTFINYQKSCAALGDTIKTASLQFSDRMTREAHRLKIFFTITAIIPLAIAFTFLCLSLYLIISTPSELDLSERTWE